MAEQEGDLLTGTPGDTSGTTGTQNPDGSTVKEGGTVVTGQSGGIIPEWHASLPADLKGNASLAKYENPNAVAKAFVELEGKLGRSIEIPGEKSTDAERSRFGTLMRGGIETPDGYVYDGIEVPDGMTLSDTAKQEISKMAFDNDFSQKQITAAIKWDMQRQLDMVKEVRRVMQTTRRDAELQLRKDWGQDFDARAALAQSVITKRGTPELKKLLTESGLGNHPDMVKMMADIGAATSEGHSPMDTTPGAAKIPGNFPVAEKMAAEYKAEHGGS